MADYIVGDLHGCFDKLISVLDVAGFDKDKDVLYSVGDLCDRGSQNLKIVEFVYSLGKSFRPVFGNHDIWLYEYFAFGNENRCWIKWNGGDATMSEIRKLSAQDKAKYAEWMSSFPYMMEVGDNVICHNFIRRSKLVARIGNLDPCGITLGNCRDSGLVKDPDYDEYVFDRTIADFVRIKAGQTGSRWREPYEDADFEKDFPSGKSYVMGHTPLYEDGYAVYNGVYMIDTGAFVTAKEYGTETDGRMTLMNLETKEVWET